MDSLRRKTRSRSSLSNNRLGLSGSAASSLDRLKPLKTGKHAEEDPYNLISGSKMTASTTEVGSTIMFKLAHNQKQGLNSSLTSFRSRGGLKCTSPTKITSGSFKQRPVTAGGNNIKKKRVLKHRQNATVTFLDSQQLLTATPII